MTSICWYAALVSAIFAVSAAVKEEINDDVTSLLRYPAKAKLAFKDCSLSESLLSIYSTQFSLLITGKAKRSGKKIPGTR